MDYEEKKRRVVAVIKEIVELVNDDEHSSSSEPGFSLWIILTALRGPDSGDEELKKKTTVLLRGHLGFRNRAFR